MEPIPNTFLNFVADVLAHTYKGLSGGKIVEYTLAYAIDFNVSIPHNKYPFEAPNKRTALKENLAVFPPEAQYKIIKELCELSNFSEDSDVKDLKIKLFSRYGYLSKGSDTNQVNEILVEETILWLQSYPEALKVYQEAINKFDNQIFQRNLLDDLRLSLEIFLKNILSNNKSLENQISEIGNFINSKNGSKELNNMFLKLIDYYCKYNNTYIKHNDAVIENEIEIILEMTSSFMKFLARLKG